MVCLWCSRPNVHVRTWQCQKRALVRNLFQKHTCQETGALQTCAGIVQGLCRGRRIPDPLCQDSKFWTRRTHRGCADVPALSSSTHLQHHPCVSGADWECCHGVAHGRECVCGWVQGREGNQALLSGAQGSGLRRGGEGEVEHLWGAKRKVEQHGRAL